MSEEGMAADVTDITGGEATGEVDPGDAFEAEKAEARAEVAKALANAEKEDGEGEKAPEAAAAPKRKAKPAAKAEAAEKPAEKPAETEESDEDILAVKNILSQRKKLAEEKVRYTEEQAAAKRELEQLYEQIQYERKQVEAQREAMLGFRKDPARAVREAGLDPEEFIHQLAKEGTPEGRMERELYELRQQLQSQQDQWKSLEQQRAQYQQHVAQQQAVQFRQKVEQDFLSEALNEEVRPLTRAFYEGREEALIAEADIIAMQYRNLTGREAPLSQIADYIEEAVAERFQKMYDRRAGSQARPADGTPSKAVGEAPLSPHSASERRSFGSQAPDLDGDELIQYAKQQAAAAIAEYRRNNPNSD